VFSVHTVKECWVREAKLHPFLTQVLDGSERLASHSAALQPRSNIETHRIGGWMNTSTGLANIIRYINIKLNHK